MSAIVYCYLDFPIRNIWLLIFTIFSHEHTPSALTDIDSLTSFPHSHWSVTCLREVTSQSTVFKGTPVTSLCYFKVLAWTFPPVWKVSVSVIWSPQFLAPATSWYSRQKPGGRKYSLLSSHACAVGSQDESGSTAGGHVQKLKRWRHCLQTKRETVKGEIIEHKSIPCSDSSGGQRWINHIN